MRLRKNETHKCLELGAGPRQQRRSLPWRLISACLVAVSALACAGQNTNPPVSNPNRLGINQTLASVPDANTQTILREQQEKQQNFEAANTERQRQIADDSAKLLKLANDLKAEVDKTTKDTLSLNVIRKADEIERLAHSVKEKMKLTVGAN